MSDALHTSDANVGLTTLAPSWCEDQKDVFRDEVYEMTFVKLMQVFLRSDDSKDGNKLMITSP